MLVLSHLLLLPCTCACRWVTLFLATNTEVSIHLLLTSMLPPHLCECLGSCRVQTFAHVDCVACPVSPNSYSLARFFFLCCHSWRCDGLANQTPPTRPCKRPVDFCGSLSVSVDNTHRQHTDLRTHSRCCSRVTAVAASYPCCRM